MHHTVAESEASSYSRCTTPSSPSLANNFEDEQFPTDVPLLRSCENCRRKKRKCSGNRPSCTRCSAQGEKCVYRPTARFFKPARHSMDNPTSGRKRSTPRTIAKHQHRRPRALSAFAAAQDRLKQQDGYLGSLAPADLMLGNSSPGLDVSQGLLLAQDKVGLKAVAGASVQSLPSISIAPPPPAPASVDGGLAYMTAGDESAAEAMYSSISLSPPHMIPGYASSPMIANSPLCDSAYATQLLLANAAAFNQQQHHHQQAMFAGQQPLVTVAGTPVYSPPLSASSFSTGISATPPLTDIVPSPYLPPYHSGINLWPTQADLVNCNLTAAPLTPMANLAISTQTPGGGEYEFMHPPRPAANAFSEWFA
ncbi:hypothetical protein GGH91_002200 [Coemansia sp. RSA 2671]|uniref:Zn(2)-C6 fungal-type domain-containing protein n=1 Tax=Coemansia spiralis TaxID=417178 RepID=A0A9W8L0W9_9FUNG|nr:hypothetical protein LPJ60_005153 [Coemansia sp. RSA 2675]KAJ2346454.1 hypothetical protein GGH91_002200 [Coemansia sp. RSA 2671]KAJ2683876.1 hypothetical protein IWW39_005241 [Coemansia spiralis]